jgi:hypothetical protein
MLPKEYPKWRSITIHTSANGVRYPKTVVIAPWAVLKKNWLAGAYQQWSARETSFLIIPKR